MDLVLAVRGARVLVAVVLFTAGVSKVWGFRRFRHALSATRLFNRPSVALILIGVPVVELTLPVWLLVSIESRPAAWAVVLLLFLFTAYIVVLRSLGRDGACGCLGGRAKISDPFLALNLGLIVLAAAGLSETTAVPFLAAGGTLLMLRVGQSWFPRRHAISGSGS